MISDGLIFQESSLDRLLRARSNVTSVLEFLVMMLFASTRGPWRFVHCSVDTLRQWDLG